MVKIGLVGGALAVENRRRPRPLEMSIDVTPDRFTVRLPLLSVG